MEKRNDTETKSTLAQVAEGTTNAWMESAIPPFLVNGLTGELTCQVSATNVYSASSP